ncbi:hybrid-cluster NAD(P)-dependent oxidoreductase [Streptomyces oryzae]|uniref:Hybrid-cluster NAD(P)-dependent oxidoreductase n=1 Tax=Streptomyces oryzae TaxID=1434886 RepID=A0ABS3X6M4_9ACTN|nr:hybrid-cluster NAD(P)-dependent oxidoreductase [Streptomyces oryzae]MBO8191006.1 hybrid-cluster NAD(P)-dependent oxidoreductase [Streptomyces oryzae]
MTGVRTLPVAPEALRLLTALREQDGATDHTLVCTSVHSVTRAMKTFVFEPAEPALFRHEPGQHLVFTFEIDGRQLSRCYTLSSPPTRPHVAAITVKRVPGGRVSNWLHDRLAPGRTVRARGPFGRFSLTRHPSPGYLFLSGGSGITPLMSMTRTLYDLASPADVVFVHSARTPDDIPYRQELELIAATAPSLRVTHICEDDGETERWRGYRGRLTLGLLRQIAPDLRRREVFSCGPPGYMQAVRRLLCTAGHPQDRHHQETFEAPHPAPTSADSSADSGGAGKFAVQLSRSGTTIECDVGTPVLEAAARAGITLPSACGQGMCGSCVTTLEKGSVDMRHNGGISPRDAAQHKILLCCSTPLEDLVIDA